MKITNHLAIPSVTLAACLLCLAPVAGRQVAPERSPAPLDQLDRYNVVWQTPSRDASGSMPIGNGEVGLNAWVEEGGDLLFYIARTDAWSEISRLLKLGRIRVRFSSGPFAKGTPFVQELKLREGRIEIAAGAPGNRLTLSLLVDARFPVIHLVGESEQPITVRASLESWRTERHLLSGDELQSTWTMQQAPADVPVWESGDVIEPQPANTVTWFHRNAFSIVPLTLKHQGLEEFKGLVTDPLVNRTFGGRILARGFKADDAAGIRTDAPTRRFHVRVVAHSAQTESLALWNDQVTDLARKTADPEVAVRETAAWWRGFWNRSWIFVDGEQGEAVTRAYVLQRWMTAAAGRGASPIKFNGSIFTVEPEYTGGPRMNADWRRWGDCYWWQNTRLPYFPMVARGDFDELAPLFRMYAAAAPLARARSKAYFGADGVAFPETMTIFGTWSNRDYGWDRTGHQPNEVLNTYIRHIWQPGLELTALMLDYYEHTRDEAFLETQLLPMARDVLRYFETRFPRDAAGKLVIQPTQAVETYWYDVVNDLPSVAGLRAVTERLLALPPGRVPPAEREYVQHMQAMTPPLPIQVESGVRRLMPAEKFNPKRSNVENVELYAIWPFGLLGVGRQNLELAIDTFRRRPEKASNGWQYDGQSAAAVGLADEAAALLVGKAGNSNPKHRFPAMWGPNYDWLPDQDHGSNIMVTLQAMLIRPVGDKIYLLPAWPKTWNARFKLHAPARTVVEAEVRNGELVDLQVTPAARGRDLIIQGSGRITNTSPGR
jgi:hypothetical protein